MTARVALLAFLLGMWAGWSAYGWRTESRAAEQIVQARKVEHAVVADDLVASAQYQKGIEDGKKDLDGAIGRLRGELDRVLQQRTARPVPAVARANCRRDDAPASDFLAAYGEDALRLAAEADDVARQLAAAQAQLAARVR